MADSNEQAPSTDSTVDEPQIATLDDLNFISTTTSGGASTSINSDDFVEVATVGSSSFEPMAPVVAPSAASGVFSSMGVGWLLEEAEEDDTDIQGTLLEELDIDVADIVYKVRCVMLPIKVDRAVLLSSPDFWGPMAIVLFYGLLLLWGQTQVMSWVFTLWLMGSFFIFLLARMLGADITYSQSVGVIGYSLLPLVLACTVLLFVSLEWLEWLVKAACTAWAAFSASSWLAPLEMASKRYLLMYPIVLLYIYFISLYSGV